MSSTGHIKKILLSRTDSIGDVVLTLPMAGYLKTVMPEAQIDFLGSSYTQDIVACEKHIDTFINYDELKKQNDPAQHLSKHQYDVIFHVFPRKDIAFWSKKAQIPIRIGTSHRLYHWWNLNKKVRFTRKRSDLHESQLNFKLMEGLNIPYAPTLEEVYNYLNLSIPECPEVKAFSTDNKNIILHPGSKGSAVNWPSEKYMELAKILAEKDFHIWITGTDSEAKDWKEKIPSHQNIHDVTGQFSLHELLGFIHECDGIVACSTGPLHLGGIFGLQTIGLFSPRRPIHPGRWRPIGAHVQTIVFDENCPTCKAGKAFKCIEKITPEQILERLL